MKYSFIQSDLSMYDIALCCRVLQVSRSGYYQSQKRAPGDRQRKRREELAVKIQAIHAQNRRVYGSPRVYHALLAQGESVCENTVARVMKQRQIRAKTKRKFVPRTTDSPAPSAGGQEPSQPAVHSLAAQ